MRLPYYHAMTGPASKSLIDSLREIVGADHVVTKPEELLVYECDAYTLEKHLPTAVVLPGNTREVEAVVKLCAAHQVPIIPRGAGTSLSGAVLAVDGGIMIALTRMTRATAAHSSKPDASTHG